MSGPGTEPAPDRAAPSPEQRQRTLERFEEHRRAWARNPALRALYADWYGRVASALPPPALGPRVEVGSGPGFARLFIPDLELTDVVRAPWHDREIDGTRLPYADGSLGALVLFDVLHHVAAPPALFQEASRVLRPGGRVVLCEPYVSPVSLVVYKLAHEEPVDLSVDPFAPVADPGKDPFAANQAIPTVMFLRRRTEFEGRFPALAVRRVERLAGLSYPASGGFSRGLLLPFALWRLLHGAETRLPALAFRLLAFRMLVVLERR